MTRRHHRLRHPLIRALCLCALLALGRTAAAQEVPDRYGLGLTAGHTVNPVGDIGFLMLTGTALFDYEKVWRHPAPDPLRFKVEANLGGSVKPERDFMASAGILALYFVEPLAGAGFKPYVEAGIGAIYTQHRVDDQGLHFNFNPQIGFGTEYAAADGATYYASLRWHHLSNGGLDHQNSGVDSIVLVIGRYFW
jgi:hypothetical protein